MQNVASTLHEKDTYCTNQTFWFQWGFQAFFVYLMVKVLYRKIKILIPLTYIPILKLSVSDPEAIDREYEDIQENQHEKVNFTDSPREKWRKLYGNMTREFEWIILELYKVLAKEQVDELFLSTMTIPVGAWVGWLKPPLEKIFNNRTVERTPLELQTANRKMLALNNGFNRIFNLPYFLVGPTEVTDVDLDTGVLTMEVDECAYHLAGGADTLPEHGCQLLCKGVCERIFNQEAAVKIEFDPHLPETSCTLKVYWKHRG